MKSEIFRRREDFWSAIFYMKMASMETVKGCEQEDQVRHATQKANLIEILIDASKKKDEGVALLKEAKKMIETLPKEITSQLIVHAYKAEIDLHMRHPKLSGLKTSALEFEDAILEKSDSKKGDENLRQKGYNVFHESKSTLDHAMRHLKDEAFADTGYVKNIYFPYRQDTKEKLVGKFEEMKFEGISQKFPEIIDFVFAKIQPPWVKTFIDIRNTKVKFPNPIRYVTF